MFKQACAFLALFIVLPIYANQSLSGVVYSKNKHQQQVPVTNATVEIHGHNHAELTDENGRFVLQLENKNSNKSFELHISAKGYQHKNIVLTQPLDTYKPMKIEMVSSVMEQIDVYASPLHSSTIESASAISVISDEELRNKHSSTLGDTLKSELGVHSSYFGPVSSSPIIRGLDGPRVMITQNSLDASDASRVGPDHVVSTETSTVKQIEILRGPATLLFGNGAIGGVVNVVDNRVPTNDDFEADYQVSHNTVANENEASVNFSSGLAAQGFDNVAVHFDAFTRSGDDYKIPEEAEAHDEEEEHEEHEEEFDGTLANTAADADGFNVGASYLLDSGFVGVSFGQLNRLYGIPGHTHEEEEEEEHEEELVQGDMTQNRVQVLSEFEFNHSFVTGLQTKFGFTDYQHAELENGERATEFKNKTSQLKSDLILAEMAGWHAALSFEYKHSDFSAIGEEAFTPASVTESKSVALLEEKHLGPLLLQLGARVESIEIEADLSSSSIADTKNTYDFTPVSLSSGIVWDFTQGYNLGVSLTRSERAPSASELFSYGAHIGTGSFEVGSVYAIEFDEDDQHNELVLSTEPTELETATNAELTLRKFNGDFGFIVNVFYNTIDNFYYSQQTGLTSSDLTEHEEEEEHHDEEEHEHEESDLPVYNTRVDNAKFYGIESQFKWQLSPELKVTLQADSIIAKLTSGEYLPRIPPNRIGVSVNYQGDNWDMGINNMFYDVQDKLAPLETETDSYNMTDIDMAYYFQMGQQDMTAFANIRNVFNVAARVHSSYLKDVTLLPARGLHIGVRGKF